VSSPQVLSLRKDAIIAEKDVSISVIRMYDFHFLLVKGYIYHSYLTCMEGIQHPVADVSSGCPQSTGWQAERQNAE